MIECRVQQGVAGVPLAVRARIDYRAVRGGLSF